ncbi:MAG: DUF3343 domain-containing protein [Raoultibacter sp.]
MSEAIDYYFAFDSTHCAMAASKVLGDEACIIATPSEITANCGMTIKLSCSNDNAARLIAADLAAQDVRAKLYVKAKDGYAEL